MAIKQAVNYTFKSKKSNTKLFVQLEAMEGFLKNRRDWDFLARKKIDKNRLDINLGFRIGWILTLNENKRIREDIYY